MKDRQYIAPFFLLVQLLIMQSGLFAGGSHYTVFHYKSSDYQVGTQNWGISPDASGRFFVANNSGLLIIEGSGVSVYPLPNGGLIRSVACYDNRVYTGSFEEFGYWEEKEGRFEYTSLIPLVDSNHFKNDEIWKIVQHNKKLYFQSFGNIFVYDGKSVELINLPGSVLFLIQSGERLFIQEINGGLNEIKNQKFVIIEGSESIFSDTEIKSIIQLEKDKFIIGTGDKGLFIYDGKTFQQWGMEVSETLIKYKLNNGIRSGNQLIFGTILKGIVIADLQGRFIQHIHSGNGLQNNTVLSIYSNGEGNIWAGLDKGIDHIWLNSPLKTYHDNFTEAGSVYTAALFEDKLYLGTNQGIYSFTIDNQQNIQNKSFIEGSQGQVWFIKEENGALYCGLNDGTYCIKNGSLERVSDINGGYNFIRYMLGNKEIMLQSTYTDIVVYENQEGKWTKRRSMGNFSAPIRYMCLDHLGNMFLGHAVKGLYIAEPSLGFDSVISYRLLTEADGLKTQGNRVFKINNRIVIPSPNGFYQWDPLAGKFAQFNELNKSLGSFAKANTAIEASHGRYWFIKKDEIGLFEVHQAKAKLIYRIIPEMFKLNLVDQYENIVALNDSIQLVCLEDGFGIINLNDIERLEENTSPPSIRGVGFINYQGNQRYFGGGDMGEKLSAGNAFNTVNIWISGSGAVNSPHFIQFRLEGIDEQWSGWQSASKIEYTRLPPGNYTFHVRGLSTKGMETEEAVLHFRIQPPWYLRWYSIVGYIILIFVFVILLYINYKRRKWRRQEQMLKEENERIKALNRKAEADLMKITNDQLQNEVLSKNLELAKNTMSMVRKNELLIEIRDELDKQREELGNRLPARYYTKINKLIENSLNSEHDWEMFENLFDQAHENFFKRLKQEYPDLTPSDFRLCAYLRMNLSSKEIAPLLNISLRGVEEKRYRLRKKINLNPEQNLTEFIIEF